MFADRVRQLLQGFFVEVAARLVGVGNDEAEFHLVDAAAAVGVHMRGINQGVQSTPESCKFFHNLLWMKDKG